MNAADQSAPTHSEVLPPPSYQADVGSALRAFLSTSSGSVLFFLSALFVLYGIGSIIGPILGNSGALRETLPAIGAMGIYELSVFAVLLALVLRWNVAGDTVTLVVLVGVFLVALGMLISTVANDEPTAIIAVGVFASVVACLELGALRRWVRVPFSLSLLFASGMFVLWNALSAPAIALWLQDGGIDLARAWQWSAFVPIAAMLVAYLGIVRAATGGLQNRNDDSEFLNTPGMAWVFFGALACGSSVHLYAHLYIFDLEFYLVDFLPLITLGAFAICEVIRAHHPKSMMLEPLAGLFPVVTFILAIAGESYDTSVAAGAGHLGSPWITLVAGIGLGVVYALRRAHLAMGLVPLGYLLALLLLAPSASGPDQSAAVAVNWGAFRLALMIVVPVLALLSRNSIVVVMVIFGAVLALPQIEAFRSLVAYRELHPELQVSLLGTILGAGMTGTYVIFGSRMPRQLAYWSVGIFVFAAIVLLAERAPGAIAISTVAASVVLSAAVLWRTREVLSSAFLAAPACFGGYLLSSDAAGWRYVVLGFLLLAGGAALSIRNQRSAHEPDSL